MAYYPEELVEEIRQRTDIVDLISGYVRLQKKGSTHFGLCPFHNEKTPSFSVSGSKQMYFCFGCHAGGNVFTFLQKYENMSFPEAVRFLAEKTGVKLPEAEESEESKRARSHRDRLYALNNDAAVYFYRALRSPQGSLGMKYFEKRGLDAETLKRFGLGYSLQYSNDLAKYLTKQGYTAEELRDSGLCTFSEKYGMGDKFINRVMFPIQNAAGRVIAFGGRVMGEGEPKYLNSNETAIFEKRKNLYGLHLARSSRADNYILCEGYMDVISLHRAGFSQAMASLGTSFTPEQAMILKRFGKKVLLSYDSDTAGTSAALRAIGILRECGLRGQVIDMQPYKDPDEFIRALGAEEYRKRIDGAENGFMFEIRILRRDYNTEDPAEKTAFQREVAKKLCVFEEEMERENYLDAVAEEYGIPREALKKQMIAEAQRDGLVRERRVEVTPRRDAQSRSEDHRKYAERLLLTWLSEEPERYERIREYISEEDFSDPVYKKIAARMFRDMAEGPPQPAAILNMFEDAEEQQTASEVFHTKLDAVSTAEEKEKAFRDIVVRIKQNRMDTAGQEGGITIEQMVEMKNLIERLRTRSKL